MLFTEPFDTKCYMISSTSFQDMANVLSHQNGLVLYRLDEVIICDHF